MRLVIGLLAAAAVCIVLLARDDTPAGSTSVSANEKCFADGKVVDRCRPLGPVATFLRNTGQHRAARALGAAKPMTPEEAEEHRRRRDALPWQQGDPLGPCACDTSRPSCIACAPGATDPPDWCDRPPSTFGRYGDPHYPR